MNSLTNWYNSNRVAALLKPTCGGDCGGDKWSCTPSKIAKKQLLSIKC